MPLDALAPVILRAYATACKRVTLFLGFSCHKRFKCRCEVSVTFCSIIITLTPVFITVAVVVVYCTFAGSCVECTCLPGRSLVCRTMLPL